MQQDIFHSINLLKFKTVWGLDTDSPLHFSFKFHFDYSLDFEISKFDRYMINILRHILRYYSGIIIKGSPVVE